MAQEVGDIAAVSIKVPEFWTNQPRAWFHTVEAQFALRKVSDDATKFYHVVASLGCETAATVEGLLNTPPATGKYGALKEELLKAYELSDKQKKIRLLSLDGLGDRKPTELLRYMKTLHTAEKDDLLFMALFMQQLPQQVRFILSSREFDDVDKLAKAADDVLAEQSVADAVNIVRRKERPHAGNRPQHSSRSTLCYYHRRFGSSATKCQGPCTWAGNAVASD